MKHAFIIQTLPDQALPVAAEPTSLRTSRVSDSLQMLPELLQYVEPRFWLGRSALVFESLPCSISRFLHIYRHLHVIPIHLGIPVPPILESWHFLHRNQRLGQRIRDDMQGPLICRVHIVPVPLRSLTVLFSKRQASSNVLFSSKQLPLWDPGCLFSVFCTVEPWIQMEASDASPALAVARASFFTSPMRLCWCPDLGRVAPVPKSLHLKIVSPTGDWWISKGSEITLQPFWASCKRTKVDGRPP